jgi:truncated hemoglobin YjbI
MVTETSRADQDRAAVYAQTSARARRAAPAGATEEQGMSTVELLEQIGGQAAVARIAEELYVEMLLDDRLSDCFRGRDLSTIVRGLQRSLLMLVAEPDCEGNGAPERLDALRGVPPERLEILRALLANALEEVGVAREPARMVLGRIDRYRELPT